MEVNRIIQGDALEVLKTLDDESIDCCVTSPPYWGLRDYGVKEQLGLEKTPEEYVTKMVEVFREVKRVLKDEGTLWLNLGDSYNSQGTNMDRHWDGRKKNFDKGKPMMEINRAKDRTTDRWGGGQNKVKNLKPKDLVGIPWRVAFALQADGWYLRQDIIWHKPNPMPESVIDRCTKSHEYIFLLSKNPKYYFNQILEPLTENSDMAYRRKLRCGRKYGTKRPYQDNQPLSYKSTKANEDAINKNKRSVWTITTKPFKEAHFATFPEDLIVPMVKAGCPPNGIILDPFMGSGTTGVVAKKLNRNWLGIDLNEKYCEMARKRIKDVHESLF